MKSVAVIGSRTFADYDLLEETLVNYQISKLIGWCKGCRLSG